MFTIKFYKHFNDDSNSSSASAVSCPRYDIYERGNGSFEVVVYRSHVGHEDGVAYQVSNDRHDGYQHCYVTNEAGKTVDTIRASDEVCSISSKT